MRLLLDTHVLAWALGKRELLSADTLSDLVSPDNAVLFSIASIWEIAIKHSLGRDDFRLSPRLVYEAALEAGFDLLPVRIEHLNQVAQMPRHEHGDPFDRLLIAQAQTEPLLLLTRDRRLTEYGDMVRLV